MKRFPMYCATSVSDDKRDAERYRKLRGCDELPFNLMALDMVGEKLDAAVDALVVRIQR